MIVDLGMIVIDMCNDYEVVVGSFVGVIDFGMVIFCDFFVWFCVECEWLLGSGILLKVVMFCMGGICCEKLIVFFKVEGVEEVFYL